MNRLGKRVATALTALTLGAALISGCSGSGDTTAATPSTTASRQSVLPSPVLASTSEVSAPTSLTVDGETAVTVPVATSDAGVLLPPQDVGRLGWWVDSALPGSGHGTVVVTGHVDESVQGDGFASRFDDLRRGDEVSITTAGGDEVHYRVDRVVTADKSSPDQETGLPTDELNRLDGPETLALVTCGGPFVGPPLGYRDNIIAFATPV